METAMKLLCRLLREIREEFGCVTRTVDYAVGLFEDEGERSMLTLEFFEGQKTTIRLTYKNDKGQGAKIDGAPDWKSSDESLITVSADPQDTTGLTAIVRSRKGVEGQASITIDADVDLGAGVKTLTDTITCNVHLREAKSVDIMADPIVDDDTDQ